MSAADVASRLSQRPDFDLIAYADVGLPSWRMRTRCELLARKRISPIDEFILRSIKAGVDRRTDMMFLLGLDKTVLDAAVGAMLADDWLVATGDEQVALTEKGEEVRSAAVQESPEERTISFEFDGLLRRPELVPQPLEPGQLAALGAREIPPHPTARPDELELHDQRADVERLIRSVGGPRDREVDLLAIKEVMRRQRVFREATALLFRAKQGNELRVAFAIDGQLSDEHEQRFAQAGLLDRIGIARGVRSRTRHPALLTDAAKNLYDPNAERDARADVAARQAAAEAVIEDGSEAAVALTDARRRMRALPVRTIECYEHQPLLEVAIRSARAELAIISPRVTGSVLDEDTASALRRALGKGVRIRIGYGVSRDAAAGIEDQAHERLRRLKHDFGNLHVEHLGALKVNGFIRDGSLAVITNFPLLAHRGDASRALGDERGWLLSAPEAIAAEQARDAPLWERATPRVFVPLPSQPRHPVPVATRPRRRRGS